MNQSQRLSGISKFILVGLGVIITLLGLALAAGGMKLVNLGGSWYFLVGGLVMAVSGLLIARFKLAGAWLFAAFLVGTAIWTVSDAGLVFWPVFSRLFMFSAVGLAVTLVYPLLKRANGSVPGRGTYGVAAVLAIGLAVAAGNMFVAHPTVAATGTGPGLTVSIVGFDNAPFGRYSVPMLSSVHVPVDEMGEAAVARLLHEVYRLEPPDVKTFEAILVRRDSLARSRCLI